MCKKMRQQSGLGHLPFPLLFFLSQIKLLRRRISRELRSEVLCCQELFQEGKTVFDTGPIWPVPSTGQGVAGVGGRRPEDLCDGAPGPPGGGQ